MNNKNKDSWIRMGGAKTHANARLIATAVVFGGYYLAQVWGLIPDATSFWPDAIALFATAYAGASYYWASQLKETPPRSLFALTAVIDLALVSVAGVVMGPLGPAVFPLYLMLVFAYGIPNGEYLLQITAGLSSLAFSMVYVLNPWWGDPVLAASLLLSLFFLPLMMVARLPESGGLAMAYGEADAHPANADALSELSQELHSQISEVISSSEGLLKQRDMSPRKKKLTRSIADNSANALRLVKEVDEYARLSSGQHDYDKRGASLINILKKVRHQVTDEADKKCLNYEVIFQTSMLRQVETCPNEISRVLEHLLFNAIKYTNQGFVRVTVKEETRKTGLVWRFEVADSGTGIDGAEQESVFEPFVRTHSGRVHENRGIGLGTTIARQLVDGMNGSIGMDSEINEGSTFWFEVPVVELEAQPDCENHAGVLSCLSLSTKEKQLMERLESGGLVNNAFVLAEDFPDQQSENADALLIGENVSNQQFIHVLDLLSQGLDVPPVMKLQRLQSDDMVIYSRQQGGDIYFLPTSVEHEYMGQLLAQMGQVQTECVEEPETTKEKLSVLIADGSSVSRDILATMLVNRGHQIYMARSPVQAMDILSGIKLDLVLLDPKLMDDQVLSGIEHCQDKGQAVKCLLLGERTAQLPAQLEPHLFGEIPRPFTSSMVYEKIEKLFGLTNSGERGSDKKDNAVRKLLFTSESSLLDVSILAELEKVDTGQVLVNRFVQKYSERSKALQVEFSDACVKQDYQLAIDVLSELANASEQIGLNRLASYCSQRKSMQQPEFMKKITDTSVELSDLINSSLQSLHQYSGKTNSN